MKLATACFAVNRAQSARCAPGESCFRNTSAKTSLVLMVVHIAAETINQVTSYVRPYPVFKVFMQVLIVAMETNP